MSYNHHWLIIFSPAKTSFDPTARCFLSRQSLLTKTIQQHPAEQETNRQEQLATGQLLLTTQTEQQQMYICSVVRRRTTFLRDKKLKQVQNTINQTAAVPQ
ncbi:hypothetical protein Tsp_07856 [Trichinella spiralis]|uniref:hypothetical protein n=1 Tax=Trichinella spiralis TaxID=6334 RepID=UPI0001EFD019|nr:hypothetical protein Tsp_07856 [Trichinella spiralis]